MRQRRYDNIEFNAQAEIVLRMRRLWALIDTGALARKISQDVSLE